MTNPNETPKDPKPAGHHCLACNQTFQTIPQLLKHRALEHAGGSDPYDINEPRPHA